ncbi:MAG: hypothetical protein U0269_16765 [Polyangiales bacterium]
MSCTRAPQPSATPAADALAPRAPEPPTTAPFTTPIALDATAEDAAEDAWQDAGPPLAVRVHPVLESLRAGLLVNATPDLRYTIERTNLDNTDRGDGRAIYYAIWDYAIRVMLPAALYRPLDWRWPRTRIVDDATLLSAASQYTDDAFTLDRAPSFDMRCLSDTCPREAERRADCNSRPLDFVRGMMDATVSRLRTRNAALARSAALADGAVIDAAQTDGGAADSAADGATDEPWTDEDYCSAAMTLIVELSVLTEARADCRSAQTSSVAMLHAIAATARHRRRPAGTPVPFRDASVVGDGG